MKNKFTFLCLLLATLLLATSNCVAQPPQPPKPASPGRPPVAPAPALAPEPRRALSQEEDLVADEAALAKANASLVKAEAKLGPIFGLPDGVGRSLVIPKDSEDPKTIADTEEDLNVMARILEKAASTRDERN